MIIIGEKINSTRKAIKQAIADKDVALLQKLAVDQEAAGADAVLLKGFPMGQLFAAMERLLG